MNTVDNTATKKALYRNSDVRPTPLVPDFSRIPDALLTITRWVMWRLLWVASGSGGRWTKPPHSTGGVTVDYTAPAVWTTAAAAEAAYVAGGFDGVGVVLGDGICGIDLDECRDPATGVFDPWAREILDACGTYAEVSPSGTGAKIFGRGVWNGGVTHQFFEVRLAPGIGIG